MIIPKSQLKKWASLKEQGDLTQMSESATEVVGKNITRQTIAKALERGRCNEETYKVISTFYEQKEAAI